MKWSFTLILSFFLLTFANTVKAQDTCSYTLELFDSFGDGWNGAFLTITINGESATYTVDDVTDDGFTNTFSIPITEGDTVIIEYSPGTFENEVTYNFINPIDIALLSDGPFPETGEVFNGTLSCSCFGIDAASVVIDDVRAFIADISWSGNFPEDEYIIEIDTSGFELGTGNLVDAGGNSKRLTGLEENTAYDFYISVACSNGDTSDVVGPYSFTTLWANDVGVANVVAPMTDCGLGFMDTIFITLQNYGGTPQSLIPFNFSVNGIPGGVSQPTDGFFTGVLGTDSLFVIDFETFYDFSEPGEYLLEVWTELEGDSVPSNDTARLLVTNIPIIETIPYFENFETWSGGYLVDQSSLNPTWEFGQPQGVILNNAASGTNAWVTNLDDSYNNNETSYLVAPCFNFTGLENDPYLSFALNVSAESNFDGLWIELSLDGGENWDKLGLVGTGTNWYTEVDNNFGDWWSGQINNWFIARHVLEGTADSSDVRIRFAFDSDGSVTFEGFAIDNVYVYDSLTTTDLGAVTANHTAEDECGSDVDEVTIDIFNYGTQAISNFDVSYQVNGGPIITENVGDLEIAPGEGATYTFLTPFNSLNLAPYSVMAWVDLGDEFLFNDTTNFIFSPFRALPLSEDFESGNFPGGWTSDEFGPIAFPGAHNNPSFNLTDNVYSGDPSFEVITSYYGPVEPGSRLSFDYRYVDFFAGTDSTIIGGSDSLIAQVQSFCSGEFVTVLVIDSTNHVPSTDFVKVGVDLDDFVGEFIRVRLFATWGVGDYWVDIDNINVVACPADLGLVATGIPGSDPNLDDGAAIVVPSAGQGPYTYMWSNGTTGDSLVNVMPGEYFVTVTDNRGCMDEAIVNVDVDIVISTEELAISEINLVPNPTKNTAQLHIEFLEMMDDVQVQLINMMGQVLHYTVDRQVASLDKQLDLSQYPAGLYLVRVVANDRSKTLKLIRAGE